MVSYHPQPMYDVYILFLAASAAMCSMKARSVIGGFSARGAFRRIFEGIVLLMSSSRLLTPIFSNISGKSVSWIPICRLAKTSVFMIIQGYNGFVFFYLKNGFSSFSAPMVVIPPCPGYTVVSLGRQKRRLQIPSRNSSKLPPARSARPMLP